MNRLIFVLIAILISSSTQLFAQGNDSFRYQAVIQGESGTVMANRKVSFLITILRSAINKERVYAEAHTTMTDAFGMVNIAVGKGNPVFKTFNNIDWASDEHFIKIEMDENGGTNFKMLSESQLMTVPYAIHARTVSNADDADADPANELQTLTLADHQLTIVRGNTITLPSQTLSIDGNELTISNGNSVVLPSGFATPDPAEPVPVSFRGKHLYAHPTDNASSIIFGPFLNAGATSDFDGKSNTNMLVNAYGSGLYAAKVCDDLEAFGHEDWYLPSRAELDAIFKQNYLIADYVLEDYWSSTETAGTLAYAIDFENGQLNDQTKNQAKRCRCVRSE